LTLKPEQMLSHYRLIEKIGEGGMGVVWKAEDTSLHRDVAIKILPASFAAEPDRLVRFEREARLLASLNHANIASVYGLHQAGAPGETVRFIAMEFVEGEDLAQRLARGPLQVDEALEIARRVADGMASAHESGTIHRDLKPANVRLSPAGEVKVLDFGLARVAEPIGGDIHSSPTITTAGTAAGVMMGTAPYMSPEQARGRTVDKRADVWAFGCLLYECLTRTRAFPGETFSEIFAEILKGEPDWSLLPDSTPPAVLRLLRRCLAKDPAQRLRDLADAALELAEGEAELAAGVGGTAVPGGGSESPRTRTPGWLLPAIALGSLAAGITLGAVFLAGTSDDSSPAGTRVTQSASPTTAGTVLLPPTNRIAYGLTPIGFENPLLTLSPDGRHLVYVGRDPSGDVSRLYRQDLSTFDPPQPIAGTEDALYAFFSPDGQSLGFLTNDKLKRVNLNGDRLQPLGDLRSPNRAAWLDDGYLYVADDQGGTLRRFAAEGNMTDILGELPLHGFSDMLPDGSGAIYHKKSVSLTCLRADVHIFDLETKESKLILQQAYDARLWGDRIVFMRGSTLVSALFDHQRKEVVGEPEILLREVAHDSIFGQTQVALSRAGTLAYLPGGDRSLGKIAWIDRDGSRGQLPAEARTYGTFDLNPDGRQMAVHVGDVRDYIWLYDLQRHDGRRLPGEHSSGWPRWNNAGDAVTYIEMGNTYRIVEQRINGRDEARLLFESSEIYFPKTWTPGDRSLALGRDAIHIIDPEDGGKLVQEIAGSLPSFSPDGKWIAYSAKQTGVYETLVRSWPDGDQAYSVQTEGGIESLFAANGELFYRLGDQFFGVQTDFKDGKFSWEAPRLAFEIPFLDTPGLSYDVTADGQRLYTIVQAVPDVDDRIRIMTGLSTTPPGN
jgi:WD40 repeat protein